MRSFSSKLLIAVFLLSLNACSLAREENPRQFMPTLPLESGSRNGGKGTLDDLFTGSRGISACDWILSLGQGRNNIDRFQLLGDWAIDEERSQLIDVRGNLNASGSPLYSYSLLTQVIPDKDEFLALIDQELQKTPSFFKRLPIILGRTLMRLGLMNPYHQRNKIIQNKINDALPGIFSQDGQQFKFRQSIPWAIFRAGNPALEKTKSLQIATAGSSTLLKDWVRTYSNSIPLFSGGTWQSLEVDFRMGLSVSVRGMLSKIPAERSCSTVLFHHAFGQLLSLTGYDRLPMAMKDDQKSSRLLSIADLLDTPEGKTFVVCPGEGSFVLEGRRRVLDRDALSNFEPDRFVYDLLKTPQPPAFCERAQAVPLWSNAYTHHQGEIADHFADATDWLSFANSVAHFLITFNPGATWWKDPGVDDLGFPLSPFDTIEKIRASGAILPTDAHALSLALLNISVGTLLKRHIVMLDEHNREVRQTKDASKIRVSRTQHRVGDPEVIDTPIRAATLMTETVFKFSDSLDKLAIWKKNAQKSIQDELSRERDPKTRATIMRDFDVFVESMFGSKKTLDDLTDTSEDSIRSLLTDAKEASSMLLAAFALREPGIDSETPKIDCYSSLFTDLGTGEERKVGLCTPEEKALWKYTLGLIAKEYHSPFFQKLAESE